MKVVIGAPYWVDETWFQDGVPEQRQAVVWSKVRYALMSGSCTRRGEMRHQWETDNTDDTDSWWGFYRCRQERTWSVGHFTHEAKACARIGEVCAQEPAPYPTSVDPGVEFWGAAQYTTNLHPHTEFPVQLFVLGQCHAHVGAAFTERHQHDGVIW